MCRIGWGCPPGDWAIVVAERPLPSRLTFYVERCDGQSNSRLQVELNAGHHSVFPNVYADALISVLVRLDFLVPLTKQRRAFKLNFSTDGKSPYSLSRLPFSLSLAKKTLLLSYKFSSCTRARLDVFLVGRIATYDRCNATRGVYPWLHLPSIAFAPRVLDAPPSGSFSVATLAPLARQSFAAPVYLRVVQLPFS
ncbi:hypothetical protein Q31a_35550 [Aureliella helgolandensis]|uniref:Uncharacterized protein n=1 Tax=Aureliella helgolandensis TaxID=2527968 RepID=A0A518G9H8_9BACT|nr:hypothetical protein Q31a_35550 [Aureliella helgolandensis]